MTTNTVNDLLDLYHQNLQRLHTLREQAEELRASIETESSHALEDAAIRAQQYSGMPHSGAINRSVEDTALRFADGYKPPNVQRWMDEHAHVMRQISGLSRDVAHVDRWLAADNLALTTQERLIVRAHRVDHMAWRELSAVSTRLLGYHMSESGLRKLERRAMDKIYAIAT